MAQSPLDEKKYSDSLNEVLKHTRSDSIKVRTNFLLSDHWSAKDTIKARQYLEQAGNLADKYPYLKALYVYYTANLYFETNPAYAEVVFMQSDTLLSKFTTKEAYLFRSKAWHNFGVLRQHNDDSKGMTDALLQKAIPLAQKAADSGYVGLNYSDVGLVFMNQWQYDKAELYYKKAIPLLKRVPARNTDLLYTYIYATNNYLFENKLSEAKMMLDNAAALLAPYPQSDHIVAYCLSEGMYFAKMKQYDKALISLDKGIRLAKKLNQSYMAESLLFQKYKVYTAQKRYKKAKEVLLLVVNGNSMSFTQNYLMHYYELSETYSRLGNSSQAYKWLKKYTVIRDSVYVGRLNKDINELEIKFRNSESQKKIAALEAEKQKAALSAKNIQLSNLFLGAMSLFLLIVAALSLFYYRNNKKLSEQKEINYRQQLKDMEQKQQLTIANAMLEGEEKERTRVARDLHDGLGGMLAGVKINLSGWAASHSAQTQDIELHRIIGQLDHSVSELRHIARNMMPETLLRFGLETSLVDLCESLMTEDLRIDFQAFGIEKTIPFSAQITIYRIVQEILANAIRHARASNIVLQCSQNDATFFITAEDNGKGFDPQILSNKTGMGLNNIKNRVEYLKGKMDINSAPNEGTVINIELNVSVQK